MKKKAYILPLTALYFALALIGIGHHELFIDEGHHWLLARDSHSLAELFQNTRIEGHPLIWSFLLYAVSRFTADPFGMQLLHIAISTSAIWLFLRKAPFSILFKTLFIFGYFILFEYNLISRNYILGILFLFLACSAFKDRDRRFILICVFLALAANVHLMFSVLAFAFFLTLLLEHFQDRQLFNKEFLVGYGIFALGLAAILIQISSTQSSWLLGPINKIPFAERVVLGFGSLFKGLVNLPDFRTHYFWNSNFFINWNRPAAAVLALLAYLIPLLVFFKNRKTLFFMYTALIGMQVFFFVTQRAATRFQGMTYIAFVMALWMEHAYRSEDYPLKNQLAALKLTLLKNPIVYGILALQFISGILAYAMDLRYPFTSAKETVYYLKSEKLDHKEIISVTCDGTLLSAYLERKIWFLCDGGYQSFCHWDSGCAGSITPQKAAVLLGNYMQTHSDVVFVSYFPLTNTLKPNVWMPLGENARFRLLKKFDRNMVEKSYYYVFEVIKT